MEPQLIEQLEAHRQQLVEAVRSPGFAQQPDRDRTLARLLATDRLLSAEREPKQ